MKTDIDALMQANQIDALLVVGPGDHNPYMVYMTGGGHVTHADMIKQRGEKGVLFHGPMERDEAAKTGLATRSYSNYPFMQLMKETGGDRLAAEALRYKRMFEDIGLCSGRVALFGVTDLGSGFASMTALQKLMPEIELVGFQENNILLNAMMTKDDVEIERIRRMGEITTRVVGNVADFLTGHAAQNGVLVRPDGQPLTIGEVKSRINLLLAEYGAENPEGTIFAIGHDAGVPHSSGDPVAPLALGQTIVFDIFPCEAGGGYFYDFTRTWCLGYAPDEAQALYEQVSSVFHQILSELEINQPFSKYQARTCQLFEAMGNPTVLHNPETEVGYVHSLGHGVGLHVHELPFSGMTARANETLAPGVIVAIEPGLYYPERNLGVRLENTFVARSDGRFEPLVEFPLDLVLPLKK